MKDKVLRVTVAEAREMLKEPGQMIVHWRPGGVLTHSNPDMDLAIVVVFE
jgi:hypothetical protein